MAEQHEQGKVLALDTSTSSMALALLHHKRIEAQLESMAERNHSLHLVPAMQTMMQERGWAGNDLALIAVGIGPGSYTGVRVAVTAAKTMAWAWDKPVVGVSSLHALALSGLETARKDRAACNDDMEKIGRDWVYPLIDARRGQVYTARFLTCCDTGDTQMVNDEALTENSSSDWLGERMQEDSIRLFIQVAEEVGRVFEPGKTGIGEMPERVWFVGEIEPHMEPISSLRLQFGDRVRFLSCSMKAHWIGRIGLGNFHQGYIGETHRLRPNYTQLTEAEAKLLAKERVVSATQHKLS